MAEDLEGVAEVEIRTIDDKKKKIPIEQVLLTISHIFIALAVLVLFCRAIAQSEIAKASPTKKQQEALRDIAFSALGDYEWRIRQIVKTEATGLAYAVVDERLADRGVVSPASKELEKERP